MSAPTISRFVMRKPCPSAASSAPFPLQEKCKRELTWPSIMYEIIMTWSVSWSGNLSGALVVSMSNAMTTGSARATRSSRCRRLISPASAVTSYHSPTRTSVRARTRRGERKGKRKGAGRHGRTLVDGDAEVVRHVVLANVDDRVRRVAYGACPAARALRKALAAAPSAESIFQIHGVVHGGKVGLARDDLGVRVDGVEHVAVLGREREDLAPDHEEVGLVAEVEGDVVTAVAHEVVRLHARRASVAVIGVQSRERRTSLRSSLRLRCTLVIKSSYLRKSHSSTAPSCPLCVCVCTFNACTGQSEEMERTRVAM